MKRIFLVLFALTTLFNVSSFAKNEEGQSEEVDNSVVIDRISNEDIQVTVPSMVFSFTDADIKLKFNNPNHTKLLLNKNKVEFIINGELTMLEFVNGEASFKHKFNTSKNLSIFAEDFSYNQNITVYPLWAIITPIILIILYILKRMMKK